MRNNAVAPRHHRLNIHLFHKQASARHIAPAAIIPLLQLLLLIHLITPASAKSSAPENKTPEKKPRPVSIAVIDFSDSGSFAPGSGRAGADMLIGKLAEDPIFTISERSKIREILEEQNRSHPSDADGNSLRAGGIAGVQFIITGKVTEFGVSENSVLIPGQGNVTKYKARVSFDIKAVRVSDAKIIKTWSATGSDSSYNLGININGIPNFNFGDKSFEDSLLGKAARKAVDSAAKEISASFRTPELQAIVVQSKSAGLIADVDGNNVTTNLGRDSNISAGQLLAVYRTVKEIRDPATGELLKEKKKLIGHILILHVEDKYSEAAVMDTTPGESIAVNDAVAEEEPPARTEPETGK